MLKPLSSFDTSSVAVGPADPPAVARASSLVSTRLSSIDIVRGLVIVLMVLDHTRDFVGSHAVSPTDLRHTTTALFFTRWITHFCAPTFVFLAGASARLMRQRMSAPAVRRFLLTRGLWLVLLEFTVVHFAWNFNLSYSVGLVMQVIWAIGASMIILALLTVSSDRTLLMVGVLLVAGHNLLDPLSPKLFGAYAPLWNVLHVRGPVPFGIVLYPLLPWLGTMLLGHAAGRLFQLPSAQRQIWLLTLGSAACLLFVVVRGLNGYGDPQPWATQASSWFTLLSFLNVSKYPPSLDYLLLTLGPLLLMLALLERYRGAGLQTLRTIGQVPLFAYVLHLFLVHGFAGLVGLLGGYGTTMLTQFFLAYPQGWGFSLPAVYLTWLLMLALLYPACRWFAQHKRERKDWWLSYL